MALAGVACPTRRISLLYCTYKCIYIARRMAEMFLENNDTAGHGIGKLRETEPSAARLYPDPSELPERLTILCCRLFNNFRRKLRWSTVSIPTRRQQPVSHELLVVRWGLHPTLYVSCGQNLGTVRSQDFVDQNDFAVQQAKFKFCVCDDYPASKRMFSSRSIDSETQRT